MPRETAVVVDGVSKSFRMYRERNQSLKAALMRGRRASYEDFWALSDVAFEIPRGSTFGLIGENGSGKSTLLKCIAKILTPDKGEVRSVGSLAALLELGSGFHPELSGRENVYLNGSILGMRKPEIDAKFDAIVDFSGVGKFIDQPVKNYSSGMYVRLGFSVAINVDPDILLVDEVLAVGDTNFQDKCMAKFADFHRSGKTVIIVSHAMGSMRTMCDEVAWLQRGELLGVGPSDRIVTDYIGEVHEERVEEDRSGARYGSREVSIIDVEMISDVQLSTTRFYTGDPVTFRIHFKASERVSRPVFGLGIQTVEGQHVWAHHSRDGNYVPDYVEDEGTIDLVVPSLPLQTGTFDLNVAVVDYSTNHTFEHVREILRFDVLPRVPHESGGIVAFHGSWGNLQNERPVSLVSSDEYVE